MYSPFYRFQKFTNPMQECVNGGSGPAVEMSTHDFFRGFMKAGYWERKHKDPGHKDPLKDPLTDPLYKLKDWPTEDDFHNKIPRHCADFVRLIPFQVWTVQPIHDRSEIATWHILPRQHRYCYGYGNVECNGNGIRLLKIGFLIFR